MALYHLDPRQAGAGVRPDIEINILGRYSDAEADAMTKAALRAAREAAGFGHVAEKPCESFFGKRVNAAGGLARHCATCAWPRDAHKEGGK